MLKDPASELGPKAGFKCMKGELQKLERNFSLVSCGFASPCFVLGRE